MAEIVVGVAASHTPQLSSGVGLWRDHGERDRAKGELRELLGRDGEYHSFEELLATAAPSLGAQLTEEVWADKYRRAQDGIGELTRRLADARADVAIVIGDDQWELFQDDGVPTFALCVAPELVDFPKSGEQLATLPEGLRAAQWAAHGTAPARHLVDAGLGEHLVACLARDDFDVMRFAAQPQGRTLGHAFTFPRYRLGLDPSVPIAPLFINTYFPPNVPSARRCFRLGQAVARAVESWAADARVAVITSGGLSHFVVNEELDQAVLAALGAAGPEAFDFLTRDQMRSGNSEILNWVTAAGALTGLSAKVVDYVPGYRSLAGTGTGMAFAYWT